MILKFTLPLFTAVLFVNAACAQDWAATDLSPLDMQVPGTKTFNFTFKNMGSTGIVPYTVSWQQDNGPVQTVSKVAYDTKWSNGLGLVKDPKFTVSLPVAGSYKLRAWIKVPGDPNAKNDTITRNITVYESMPKKNVVLEIYKHLECNPCYPLAVYADTLISKNPTYSIACIYSGAANRLGTPEGNEADQALTGSTHPAPLFDRFRFPFFTGLRAGCYNTADGYVLEAYGEREQYYEPLQVYFKSVNYNSSTRELKVKVAAKAWLDMSEELRFNVYLTEDSVKAYQAEAPDPNNYYHKYVVRAMLGGAWGKQGSLPSSLKKNDEHEYEFTHTIPADYKTDKMRLIALVQTYATDKNKRRIINSEHKTFQQALSVKHATLNTVSFEAYPNPVTDKLTVKFAGKLQQTCNLKLVDMTGKVWMVQACTGDTELSLQSLAAGSYILRVDDGQVVHTQTIVKQ